MILHPQNLANELATKRSYFSEHEARD